MSEQNLQDKSITRQKNQRHRFFDPITPFFVFLLSLFAFTMVDENDLSKTRLEEDLVIDIGKGNDLVGIAELQATVLSNESSPPTSVYSDKERADSIRSEAKIENGVDTFLAASGSVSLTESPVHKAKKPWWKGRSSNMDVDPKTYSNRMKASITAVIALAASM